MKKSSVKFLSNEVNGLLSDKDFIQTESGRRILERKLNELLRDDEVRESLLEGNFSLIQFPSEESKEKLCSFYKEVKVKVSNCFMQFLLDHKLLRRKLIENLREIILTWTDDDLDRISIIMKVLDVGGSISGDLTKIYFRSPDTIVQRLRFVIEFHIKIGEKEFDELKPFLLKIMLSMNDEKKLKNIFNSLQLIIENGENLEFFKNFIKDCFNGKNGRLHDPFHKRLLFLSLNEMVKKSCRNCGKNDDEICENLLEEFKKQIMNGDVKSISCVNKLLSEFLLEFMEKMVEKPERWFCELFELSDWKKLKNEEIKKNLLLSFAFLLRNKRMDNIGESGKLILTILFDDFRKSINNRQMTIDENVSYVFVLLRLSKWLNVEENVSFVEGTLTRIEKNEKNWLFHSNKLRSFEFHTQLILKSIFVECEVKEYDHIIRYLLYGQSLSNDEYKTSLKLFDRYETGIMERLLELNTKKLWNEESISNCRNSNNRERNLNILRRLILRRKGNEDRRESKYLLIILHLIDEKMFNIDFTCSAIMDDENYHDQCQYINYELKKKMRGIHRIIGSIEIDVDHLTGITEKIDRTISPIDNFTQILVRYLYLYGNGTNRLFNKQLTSTSKIYKEELSNRKFTNEHINIYQFAIENDEWGDDIEYTFSSQQYLRSLLEKRVSQLKNLKRENRMYSKKDQLEENEIRRKRLFNSDNSMIEFKKQSLSMKEKEEYLRLFKSDVDCIEKIDGTLKRLRNGNNRMISLIDNEKRLGGLSKLIYILMESLRFPLINRAAVELFLYFSKCSNILSNQPNTIGDNIEKRSIVCQLYHLLSFEIDQRDVLFSEEHRLSLFSPEDTLFSMLTKCIEWISMNGKNEKRFDALTHFMPTARYIIQQAEKRANFVELFFNFIDSLKLGDHQTEIDRFTLYYYGHLFLIYGTNNPIDSNESFLLNIRRTIKNFEIIFHNFLIGFYDDKKENNEMKLLLCHFIKSLKTSSPQLQLMSLEFIKQFFLNHPQHSFDLDTSELNVFNSEYVHLWNETLMGKGEINPILCWKIQLHILLSIHQYSSNEEIGELAKEILIILKWKTFECFDLIYLLMKRNIHDDLIISTGKLFENLFLENIKNIGWISNKLKCRFQSIMKEVNEMDENDIVNSTTLKQSTDEMNRRLCEPFEIIMKIYDVNECSSLYEMLTNEKKFILRIFQNLFNLKKLNNEIILDLFSFFINNSIFDKDEQVRQQTFSTTTTMIELYGEKNVEEMFPRIHQLFQTVKGSEKMNVIIIMGIIGKYLPHDHKSLKEIFAQLLVFLCEASLKLQVVIAKILKDLVPQVKNHGDLFFQDLFTNLYEVNATDSSRRGAAYGIGAVCSGLGTKSLSQYRIMEKLEIHLKDDSSKYKNIWKKSTILAYFMLSKFLKKLFEPFAIKIIPDLLECFSNPNYDIREIAQLAMEQIIDNLGITSFKRIIHHIEKAMDNDYWRTKCAAIEFINGMTKSSSIHVYKYIPKLIPKLIRMQRHSHQELKNAAHQSLQHLANMSKNPEIATILPKLMTCLVTTSNQTLVATIDELINLKLEHRIDSASMAMLTPILVKAYTDRNVDMLKKGSIIVYHLNLLVDKEDLKPYISQLLPGMKLALISPNQSVRSITSKALGSIFQVLNINETDEIIPYLRTLLVSENVVERSGSAEALSEIYVVLGEKHLCNALENYFDCATNMENSFIKRDGYMTLFIYLIHKFNDFLRDYIDRFIQCVIDGLVTECEFLNETCFRCGRTIIRMYRETSVQFLLPILQNNLSSITARIRYRSLQLLGELLSNLAGTSDNLDTTGTGESYGNFDAFQRLQNILGEEKLREILTLIHLNRSHSNNDVRHSANHVWKVIVANGALTLRSILPLVIDESLKLFNEENYEEGMEEKIILTIDGLCEIIRKLGERAGNVLIRTLFDYLKKKDDVIQTTNCLLLLSKVFVDLREIINEEQLIILIDEIKENLFHSNPSISDASSQLCSVVYLRIDNHHLNDMFLFLVQQYNISQQKKMIAQKALEHLMKIRGRGLIQMILPILSESNTNIEYLRLITQMVMIDSAALAPHIQSKIIPFIFNLSRNFMESQWNSSLSVIFWNYYTSNGNEELADEYKENLDRIFNYVKEIIQCGEDIIISTANAIGSFNQSRSGRNRSDDDDNEDEDGNINWSDDDDDDDDDNSDFYNDDDDDDDDDDDNDNGGDNDFDDSDDDDDEFDSIGKERRADRKKALLYFSFQGVLKNLFVTALENSSTNFNKTFISQNRMREEQKDFILSTYKKKLLAFDTNSLLINLMVNRSTPEWILEKFYQESYQLYFNQSLTSIPDNRLIIEKSDYLQFYLLKENENLITSLNQTLSSNFIMSSITMMRQALKFTVTNMRSINYSTLIGFNLRNEGIAQIFTTIKQSLLSGDEVSQLECCRLLEDVLRLIIPQNSKDLKTMTMGTLTRLLGEVHDLKLQVAIMQCINTIGRRFRSALSMFAEVIYKTIIKYDKESTSHQHSMLIGRIMVHLVTLKPRADIKVLKIIEMIHTVSNSILKNSLIYSLRYITMQMKDLSDDVVKELKMLLSKFEKNSEFINTINALSGCLSGKHSDKFPLERKEIQLGNIGNHIKLLFYQKYSNNIDLDDMSLKLKEINSKSYQPEIVVDIITYTFYGIRWYIEDSQRFFDNEIPSHLQNCLDELDSIFKQTNNLKIIGQFIMIGHGLLEEIVRLHSYDRLLKMRGDSCYNRLMSFILNVLVSGGRNPNENIKKNSEFAITQFFLDGNENESKSIKDSMKFKQIIQQLEPQIVRRSFNAFIQANNQRLNLKQSEKIISFGYPFYFELSDSSVIYTMKEEIKYERDINGVDYSLFNIHHIDRLIGRYSR
ncbi:hypothetical protein SNEBB_000565 [Seison nebaliae]|nr:hypothetical protein SNEBB_000565 [Seison nebaliae]